MLRVEAAAAARRIQLGWRAGQARRQLISRAALLIGRAGAVRYGRVRVAAVRIQRIVTITLFRRQPVQPRRAMRRINHRNSTRDSSRAAKVTPIISASKTSKSLPRSG